MTNDKPRDTIEYQLFEWESWSDIDIGVFSYVGVTLKVSIGQVSTLDPDFWAGKKFAHCVFNTQESFVEFFDNTNDETGYKYELNISVGKKL